MVLEIRQFPKGIAFWVRRDKFFIAVQLFRSPLIVVGIKSFGSKENYEKKISDFLVLLSKFGAILNFLMDQTQFWPRILEEHTQNYTIMKHGFR